MPEKDGAGVRELPRVFLVAIARLLLLGGALAAIGCLWLAVAIGGGAPAWIERTVLMSGVAFAVYWLLGWWRDYGGYRRVLLAITLLALLPALVLVAVIEPRQRADMKRQNAMFSNQAHAESAVERFPCPDGALLVVTPWIFILDADEPRRLVELRLLPGDREKPSRLLLRHTARGHLAYREELESERGRVIACVGSGDALDVLVHNMGDGVYQ